MIHILRLFKTCQKRLQKNPIYQITKKNICVLNTRSFSLGNCYAGKKEIVKTNNLSNILNSSDANTSSADIVDQASSYTDKTVEMKALNRSRKLVEKIDAALKRIKDSSFGFCEETSEPIGLKRLIARPVATLTIEAQERHEREEKIYVDG
jgi:DnaK suppressor protein